MAQQLRRYDSVGGFSVDKTTVITDTRDIVNANTIELENRFFTDARKVNYILRGLNTSILALDNLGTQIFLESSTINFITSYITGVNDSGGGNYSIKFESAVTCSASGGVQVLSSLTTIIKDSIPAGELWTVIPFDSGASNRFSYSTVRAGTITTIKWIASTEVITVNW
jgi:hypothetical protein